MIEKPIQGVYYLEKPGKSGILREFYLTGNTKAILFERNKLAEKIDQIIEHFQRNFYQFYFKLYYKENVGRYHILYKQSVADDSTLVY